MILFGEIDFNSIIREHIRCNWFTCHGSISCPVDSDYPHHEGRELVRTGTVYISSASGAMLKTVEIDMIKLLQLDVDFLMYQMPNLRKKC